MAGVGGGGGRRASEGAEGEEGSGPRAAEGGEAGTRGEPPMPQARAGHFADVVMDSDTPPSQLGVRVLMPAQTDEVARPGPRSRAVEPTHGARSAGFPVPHHPTLHPRG